MDNLKQPLISIIVPCYNCDPFLKETLNSVINQTFQSWECIIVDDGSTDDSKIIAESYAKKDKRFTSISESNKGVSSARNKGIANSKGKYILPLDADDKIGNTYLEKASTILEMKQDVKIVYCEAELFELINGKWNLPVFNLKDMLMENSIFCTAMFRKFDYEKTNGYNEKLQIGFEDWDFWLSMLESGGNVYKIPETCFYYRIREKSRNNSLTLEIQKDLRLQLFSYHQTLYENNHLSIKNIEDWYVNKKKTEKWKNSTRYKIYNFLISFFYQKFTAFKNKK